MKCAWCQEETENTYLYIRGRKKIGGQILPLCYKHKQIVVGEDAMPLESNTQEQVLLDEDQLHI